MNSMTGFAFEEFANEKLALSIEIKSFNARFLDINFTLPSFLSQYEPIFRKKIQSVVNRGKIDIYIRVQEKLSNVSVSVDIAIANQYAQAVQLLAKELKTDAIDLLSFVAKQEGVFVMQNEQSCQQCFEVVLHVFDTAVEKFIAERMREGKCLLQDISAMIVKLENSAAIFESNVQQMELFFQQQLAKKMQELLGENLEPHRLMQEVALMLVKHTINEEVVRLKSHLAALKMEVTQNPAPGKKIDFICQEINREINTIGSKNQFAEIASSVISAKDALENIREQSRNLE